MGAAGAIQVGLGLWEVLKRGEERGGSRGGDGDEWRCGGEEVG